MGNKLIDEILRNILKSGSSVAAETVRKKNQSSGKTVTGSKQKNVNTGSIKSGIRGISSYKLYSNNKPSSSNNTIKGNTAFNNTKNNNQGIQNNFNSISKNSNTYLKDNNIKSFNQMGFENYNNMQKQKIQSKQNQKDAINKSVSNVYNKGYDYLNKGLQNSVKVLKQKSSPIYSKSGLNGSMYNSTNSDKKVNTDSIVYKGNNNIDGNLSTQNPNLNKDFMNFQKLNNQNNMLGFGFNNNYIKPYAPKTGNNNFKSEIIKNSNINNKLNLHNIKNSNIKTKIGFDDYNYYGKDILSSWGDSIENKFDLKRKTDKSDKNKTVINVKPYGIVDKSISTDVYRKKFGPGSEYSKSKIEQRNKRHEQFAPVWNNAKPMNSTKTYAEINNIPRRPGDLTKENSTNMYYEHVVKPKMQEESSAFQKNLHNFIVNTKDAPRYGDFSRRKYYAEDRTAVPDYVSRKVSEETKELLKEDYGDPGAVEYMLEKKGAENLDFSNTEALKKNPVLKDVDINLMQSMTEEEKKNALCCNE